MLEMFFNLLEIFNGKKLLFSRKTHKSCQSDGFLLELNFIPIMSIEREIVGRIMIKIFVTAKRLDNVWKKSFYRSDFIYFFFSKISCKNIKSRFTKSSFVFFHWMSLLPGLSVRVIKLDLVLAQGVACSMILRSVNRKKNIR